jgi:hypothetical protein
MVTFPQERAQLISLGTEPVANYQDLSFPSIFVVEVKGD